ncbi:translation initiation factor IF-1 [Candidatus Phytoplasma phoenicium]|uniref:Translation initiation factor IF-1 n=1 Tax=Candidatus Phytoplasma phoenicium TaxID=198422 RepID=A0A0L0MKE3_9MOLU|nr:translation initiation factor IF-1 [Candidatus Phytoplasma phoenicium]KND62770.1 translation initiation factor IF-1 [Candidatus Phytoplasma phoenicium]
MDKSNIKDARVVGVFPNATFQLELLDNKKVIFARISGKIKVNNIRILLGDRVQVDSTKRIVYRYIDKNIDKK